MAGDWSVTTGDGSITATLPRDFSAEIDVTSGDGSVSVNGVSGNSGDGADGGCPGTGRPRGSAGWTRHVVLRRSA